MTASRRERLLALRVGALLRLGVLIASAVIVLGLVPYLARDGSRHADYQEFRGEPPAFRTVSGVVAYAVSGHLRGIMQLGVLLLVATPVARVALCLFAFARQRDRLYVGVTVAVLAALFFSLLGSR